MKARTMSPHPMLVPCAAALLALAACQKSGDTPSASPQREQLAVRTVRLAPVETGDLVHAIELVGELQGVEEVRMFALMPERIRALAVREGQQVQRGELLATLHGDLQSEGVNQAQGGLEAATANRDSIQDNLKRARQLVQAGVAPRSQLETLEAQARAADAQVRQAASGVASASAQRGRTLIQSPIAGRVAQIMLRQGDLAAGGMPIMTVVRDDQLKAVFRVPEREFLHIKEGMTVTVSPLADASKSATAPVTLVGPVVDRLTRTGLVEILLDNAARALLAGTAVRGVLELSRRKDVVLVPAEAVLLGADTERTGKAIAFVSADGKVASQREVKLGARQEGRLEVVEGLQKGESLVVQGAHLLRDGNPIRVPAAQAKQENG